MRMGKASLFLAFVFVVLGLLNQDQLVECNLDPCQPIPSSDKEVLKFAFNFLYLFGELCLNSATGKGLDDFDPNLASGGPPPIGAQRANLDPVDRQIIEEFGHQTIAQLSNLKIEVDHIPRVLINISRGVVGDFADAALGRQLRPRFDPYANTLNFHITLNSIAYNEVVGLVGAITNSNLRKYREIFAGLLGVKAAQYGIVRSYLYRRANQRVVPYDVTVAEFLNRTATLSNNLGKCGVKDEGIEVPRVLGAAGQTESNIIAANVNSLPYSRTQPELLRLVYGSGDESKPGGFFPKGANGDIAKRLLKN